MRPGWSAVGEMEGGPGVWRSRDVRLDACLSALLSAEAAWRSTSRSALAAALITWWLDGGPAPEQADPAPARPAVDGTTVHTGLSLPLGAEVPDHLRRHRPHRSGRAHAAPAVALLRRDATPCRPRWRWSPVRYTDQPTSEPEHGSRWALRTPPVSDWRRADRGGPTIAHLDAPSAALNSAQPR